MAMTFSTTSYIVTAGTYTNLATCSIAVWCNTVLVNAVSNRIFGTDDLWEVRVTTDWNPGSPRFANELFSSTAQIPIVSTTVVAANTWYHVVFTITGTTAQIYVNGVLEATGTYVKETPTGTTAWIGNRQGSAAGQCWNGTLDDLRVYNKVLSAAEVATIYHSAGNDHIWDGLVNRWLMNERAVGVTATGAGTVKDLKNANNGTPTNNPVYAGSRLQWRR